MKIVWFCLDIPFRLVAFFLGLIALAAFHRFSMRIGFSIDLLMLAHVGLMFLCLAAPLRPSRNWFRALLVAITLAGIYFLFRELPAAQRASFTPSAVIMHVAELVVAVWFILRTGGVLGSSQLRDRSPDAYN